ncbi:MAG: ATP-binding protein, partial [Nocardiopsis sp. BM-2018]
MSLVDRAPLIGRASELAQLVAVLHDGRPGVVLIGHGGVGKTRLARAAVAVEAARGVEVAATVATRSTASVPLGALAGLVDDPDVRPE